MKKTAIVIGVVFVLVAFALIGAHYGPRNNQSSASSLASSSSPTASTSFTMPSSCHSVNGLPDPSCTPGAANPDVTQANIQSTICVAGYTGTIRPPTSYTDNLKRQSIQLYGYSDTNLSDYEEDHLIALEIGGNPTSVMNLWAEPHYGSFNSLDKDGLENYLHSQVCSGKMTLTEAQHEMATNWEQYWLASKGVSTTSSSSSTTANTGQIAASISFGSDPVTLGHSQTITVMASDQNGPLQNALVSVHVVYASQQTTKDFACTTSSSGTCSVSWQIGSNSDPGTFTVSALIDGTKVTSSFRVTE